MNEELRLRILAILSNFNNAILSKESLIKITDFSSDILNIFNDSISKLKNNTPPKELSTSEIERQIETFTKINEIIINFYNEKIGINCNPSAFRNFINNTQSDIYIIYFKEYIDNLSNYIKTC